MSENENPLEATEIKQVEAPKILTVSAVEAIERAEVDVAIATAKRYPRDLGMVKREMREMATKDPKVAASCSYALPRAGKVITGPSVRMAEIVFSSFGNLNAGTRVVSMGDDQVVCQAVCHDLQKNTRLALEIPRNVYPSKNAKTEEQKAAALRDAKHLAALACSKIAFREVIFGVVPRSLVTAVWEEAQTVATGKGRSFDDARVACLEEFKKIRVNPKEVCDYLEIGGVEAMTTGHLQLLFGLLTSITEGETSVEAEFGPRVKGAPKPPVKAEVPEPKTNVILTEGLTPGGRVGPETKTTIGAIPEPKTISEAEESPKAPAGDDKPAGTMGAAKPAPPVKDMFDEDDIPGLSKKAAAKPKAEPKPAKVVELDPVYSRVAKKMEQSGITAEQFLWVMRTWGVVNSEVKTPTDVRVGAMKTADNDWQAVLDELALNPNEAA